MQRLARAKALFSIYFIAAIDNCGYAMVFVLFPPLLLDPQYGFLPAHPSLPEKLLAIGALYAAFPIAQLIGAPLLGDLADHFGRKKLFFFSILGTIFAYVLTGLLLLTKSITLVFLARFLTGLFSGNQGLCNASIADLYPFRFNLTHTEIDSKPLGSNKNAGVIFHSILPRHFYLILASFQFNFRGKIEAEWV